MESADITDHSEYKSWLRETEQKLSEHFDKTMLMITGGALALSITFVKDIIGSGKMLSGWLLVTSWATLTICLIIILWSFHLGLKAYREAQNQVDSGTIEDETPGGLFSKILNVLNTLSICLLSLGLISLFTFSYINLSKESTNGTATNKTTATTNKTNASPAPNTKQGSSVKGLPSAAAETIKVEKP